MPDFYALSLFANVLIFIVAAAAIGVFGVFMTHVARRLARNTGMGEALMGAVFIGASTSLSGITASMTAAYYGHAELAVSNALGGIAAQTVFLAIADMFYRKANLEHAAASAENLMMCAFLLSLLAIPLIGMSIPELSWLGVHPASYLLVVGYLFGLRVLVSTHKMPMWQPVQTVDTRTEQRPALRGRYQSVTGMWLMFVLCSLIVFLAGWALSRSGIAISAQTGISESMVGGVFVAISTSLPELVIAITAVRLKSLTLAVGDIIGGNAFDTLFIAMSDIFYREGPIYAAISAREQFWLAITMLMSGILLMGLLQRERHGIANIGWESFLVLLIYISSLVYLV